MGGGANNKAVHTWARKFNMTTGSLVKDWEDEEDGRRDYEEAGETEEEEVQRETDEYLAMLAKEKLTERLKTLLKDLVSRWEKLPKIPGRDRKALQSEIDAGSEHLDARDLEDAEYALGKAAEMMPKEESESAKLAKALEEAEIQKQKELEEIERRKQEEIEKQKQREEQERLEKLKLQRACDELAANIEHHFFIMNRERALTTEEGSQLVKWKMATSKAVSTADLSTLKDVDKAIRAAFKDWWNDKDIVKARYEKQYKDTTKGPLSWLMCGRIGLGVTDFKDTNVRLAIRKLTSIPVAAYKIMGVDEIRTHAWRRHTPEGVWKVQAIETDHETHVALFRNEGDFNSALNAFRNKTVPGDWTSRGGAAVKCQNGNTMAYGTLMGADEVYLETCFPLGVNFPKDQVYDALRERSFAEFKNKLGL